MWWRFLMCCFDLQLSWSKSLVRKWFNIRSKAHDFHADDVAAVGRTGACFYEFACVWFYQWA